MLAHDNQSVVAALFFNKVTSANLWIYNLKILNSKNKKLLVALFTFKIHPGVVHECVFLYLTFKQNPFALWQRTLKSEE